MCDVPVRRQRAQCPRYGPLDTVVVRELREKNPGYPISP